MTQISRIIGGAGTGKTTELMRLMTLVLERGEYSPYQIGFLTFTRAARAEAASRAAEITGQSQKDLEQAGWFRTVHSIAYQQTGVGKGLLAPDAKGREWFQENVGIPVPDNDDPFRERTAEEHAIDIWSAARNRMVDLATAWRASDEQNEDTPAFGECRNLIERYEQAKRLDGRCDFTDVLGLFAGWEFGVDGPKHTIPRGEVPRIPVWFCDEQQDTTTLQNEVIRRLVENSRWAYVAGDPFQAIYGFNGANPRLLMGWEVDDRQRVLPKSYRCPKEIHELGEEILKDCSDYWDRRIQAADHHGEVMVMDYESSDWVEELDPSESTLIIARTNHVAGRIASRLNANRIPWKPTERSNSWRAPVRHAACGALLALQAGNAIDVSEWKTVLKFLPAKDYLAKGVKTRFAKQEDLGEVNNLDGLANWGAGQGLVEAIRSGRWTRLIEKSDLYVEARNQWGWKAVHDPQITVGTIHSAKGTEADKVVLVTTTTHQVRNAQDAQEGFDEERRVEYVAVTRARKKLLILEEYGKYRMEIPA